MVLLTDGHLHLHQGKSPYKNVLVNDLILDKEGKKMSKHVGNTVDPFEMLDKYGADATRWYLMCTSPAWSPTKFDEDGLIEIVSKFFGTLKNVYNFFVLYSNEDDVDFANTGCSVCEETGAGPMDPVQVQQDGPECHRRPWTNTTT